MVNNGYIAFISESGGGYDVDGNPIAPTRSISANFPCNLLVNRRGYKVLVDGQWEDAKYSIIIESYRVSSIDLPSISQVILQDPRNNPLGEFQIQNQEYLDLTQKIEIVV